jgi:hypothetical protein
VVSSLRLVAVAGDDGLAYAVQIVRALHALQEPLILRFLVNTSQLEVGIECPPWQVAEVCRAIHGVAPYWEVSESEWERPGDANLAIGASLGLPERPDWAPLRDIHSLEGAEPLSALLEAVQPLSDQEALIIQLLVLPADTVRLGQAFKDLTVPVFPGNAVELVAAALGKGPRLPRFAPPLQRQLEERLIEPAFEVTGRVILLGNEIPHLASKARSITAASDAVYDGGNRQCHFTDWHWVASWPLPNIPDDSSLLMNANELAAWWHYPMGNVFHSGWTIVSKPTLPLPNIVAKAKGIPLGAYRCRGQDTIVHLPVPDLNAGSLACIGRTGVGKSVLTANIIQGLLAQPDFPGLTLVDMPGTLAHLVALHCIPPHREQDVILLDTQDTEYPVGIPFLTPPAGVSKEAHIQSVFSIIRIIFQEQWSKTRMEDAIFAITVTLCSRPDSTLMDIPRLLTRPAYRYQALRYLDDPVALDFWRDYEALSDYGKRELSRPILHRIRHFLRSPAIRNMLCRTDGLDETRNTNDGLILLASLAGTEIQAEAELPAEIIAARLRLSIFSRLALPQAKFRQHYLVVDESQRLSGASLPALLRESRKAGLANILVTQYIDAWSEELTQSILGNVGTLVAFRCGVSDARRLAPALRPFGPEDLDDLDRYQAVVKMQVDGHTMPAFKVNTLPVESPADESRLTRIRENTRRQYARPRWQVEKDLEETEADNATGNGWEDVEEE